jgi:putative copper resistance protein D
MLAHAWQMLGTWTFQPFPGLAIALTAAAYVAAAVTVSRTHPGRPWPWRNTASFLVALALAWIVILGPVGAYDDGFFWAHMVQHIALMMIIAPLLLLGRPVLLLLRVTPAHARHRRVVPVLRSRAVRVLTDPVLTWLLFAGTLIGTHFSPFYNYCLEHPLAHDFIEHPLYLGVALLYYFPLLDGNPGPRRTPHWARLLSLALMMMPEALTGFFIYAQGHVLYPWYANVARPFGPGPLTDQQIGGTLMWAGGMLLDTGWLILAVAAWFGAEQVKTRRIDARLAREKVPACPA